MELTQQDLDERVDRVAAGDGTDEDRRLIQHYAREGFEPHAVAEDDAVEYTGPKDYAAMNVEQLRQEVADRRDGAGNKLFSPAGARRAELVSTLENNDREHAERANAGE